MLFLRFLVFLVSCFLDAGVAATFQNIALGKNFSETLTIPGVIRIAVGNSKVLRVKVVSSSTLLLTGISVGKTSLRVWTSENQEQVFFVTVTSPESIVRTDLKSRGQVAHVSLEFLELDESVGRNSGIQWPETLSFSGTGLLQVPSNFSGLNYSASFSTAQGFLHFLVKEGWAKLLTSPDLYVRLGEQAVFHSGGEFPVATGADAFGRYQRKIDWKKFGLTAKVKPDSPDEEHFQTDIQLEISELDRSYQIEGIPSQPFETFQPKWIQLKVKQLFCLD